MLDLSTYEHHTEPFAHQRSDFLFSAALKRWADNSEMGCGKSKVAIDTAGALFEGNEIDGLLVVAPKGVYRNWVGEIETHLPTRIPRNVVPWSTSQSEKHRKRLLSLYNDTETLQVFLVNYDAFHTKRGLAAALAFLENHRAMWVLDEASHIKNKGAQWTKSILGMSRLASYRRILDGTPITQDPLDLYTQCAFLSKSLLGFHSFYSFKCRYAEMQNEYRFDPVTRKRSRYQKVTGYKNLEELKERLATFSVRNLKRDCLDLPKKVYVTREFDLTPSQRRVYNDMRTLSQATIDANRASAAITLTQVGKLQQIACGFVNTDDGTTQSLQSNRIHEMLEVIGEHGGKAILWSNHVYCIQQILCALRNAYGMGAVVDFYGATSADARELAVDRIQSDPACRFLVGNPQVGGYGRTLTAATLVLYYSSSYKLRERLQSEDRTHRIGQTESVTYVSLVARGTVDERIASALRDKKDLADLVLGDDWNL